MTNNIAKIRAVLESAKITSLGGLAKQAEEALAALAELEKAAAEPVATLVGFDVETGLPADIAWHADCAAFNSGDKLYAAPPAPVAEIREVVYATAEMASRVANSYFGTDTPADMSDMMEVLGYWQRELGQALGFVKLKEPTPEECERICMCYLGLDSPPSFGAKLGREVFDAVSAVMWPKEGL